MADTLWLKDGAILTDASDHPYWHDECPCCDCYLCEYEIDVYGIPSSFFFPNCYDLNTTVGTQQGAYTVGIYMRACGCYGSNSFTQMNKTVIYACSLVFLFFDKTAGTVTFRIASAESNYVDWRVEHDMDGTGTGTDGPWTCDYSGTLPFYQTVGSDGCLATCDFSDSYAEVNCIGTACLE